MIKAIIFDLNGVFIQSRKLSDRFKEKFGVGEEEFLSALKEVLSITRLPGASNSFQYWQPYLEKWGVKLDEQKFLDFWFSGEKVNEEMVKLAGELKRRNIKIIILSNNFIERAKYYEDNFPFMKEIPDKIYYSWQTGLLKSNIEAYKNILTENNLLPEECLYFDDTLENINLASLLGIKSFIFKDVFTAKETINLYLDAKN